MQGTVCKTPYPVKERLKACFLPSFAELANGESKSQRVSDSARIPVLKDEFLRTL